MQVEYDRCRRIARRHVDRQRKRVAVVVLVGDFTGLDTLVVTARQAVVLVYVGDEQIVDFREVDDFRIALFVQERVGAVGIGLKFHRIAIRWNRGGCGRLCRGCRR